MAPLRLQLAPNGRGTHLEVTIDYCKGGGNVFTGAVDPRCYAMSVKPVTVQDGMVSFVLFQGRRFLLEAAKRYSAKRHAQLEGDGHREVLTRSGRAWELVNKYLADNGLALAAEAPAGASA